MDTFSQTFSQYFSSIQNDETIKEYQAQLQSLSLQKQQEAAQPFQDIGMALVGESAREIGGAIVKNVIDKGKNYIMNQSKSLMKDAMEKVGIDGDTIEQTLQGNLGAAMKGKVSDLLDAAKSKGESVLSDIKSQGESLLNDVQNKAEGFLDQANQKVDSVINDVKSTANDTLNQLSEQANNLQDIVKQPSSLFEQQQQQQSELLNQQEEQNQNITVNEPEFEDSSDLLEPSSNKPISSEFIPKEEDVSANIGEDVGETIGETIGEDAAVAAIPVIGEVAAPIIALASGLGLLFGFGGGSSSSNNTQTLPVLNQSSQIL